MKSLGANLKKTEPPRAKRDYDKHSGANLVQGETTWNLYHITLNFSIFRFLLLYSMLLNFDFDPVLDLGNGKLKFLTILLPRGLSVENVIIMNKFLPFKTF